MSLYRLFIVALIAPACVAPRSVMQSGRVTPRGEYRLGAEMNFNIGTASADALFDGLKDAVSDAANNDGTYDDNLNAAAKAAVAYSLDPVFASGYGMTLRYGVFDRLDAGYKYSAGAHVLDARFQFLGAAGDRAKSNGFGGGKSGLAGSVGLQYSRQSFELPSFAGLDKVGKVFGFEMTRQDFLVPVAFSLPFGADEKYGAFSFGVVGGYTFLKYGLDPNEIVKDVNGVQEVVDKVSAEKGFATVGAFFNLKAGYRFAYVAAGLAAYYQDYGRFEILDQATFDLSGMTFVPTLGLEFHY